MKYYFFLFLCLSFCSSKPTQNPLKSKEQFANSIVNKLFQAAGDFRKAKPPKVVLWQTKRHGAFYRAKKNQIILEEATYNLCKSLGHGKFEAALAFILGHELTHFFQGEKKKVGFGQYFSDDNSTYFTERHADFHGAFNTYLAGYTLKEVLPCLIDSFYLGKTYGKIFGNLEEYPSYEERRSIAQTTEKKLTELSQIFEAANILTYAKEYTASNELNEIILQSFQGSEIYNNIGINYILKAVEDSKFPIDTFYHPFQVDWNSPLYYTRKNISNKTLTSISSEQQRLLELAKLAFQKAVEMHPNYYLADINLMSTHLLLNNIKFIIDYYKRRQFGKLFRNNLLSDSTFQRAKMVFAIACLRSDNKKLEDQGLRLLYTLKSSKLAAIQRLSRINILVNARQFKSDSLKRIYPSVSSSTQKAHQNYWLTVPYIKKLNPISEQPLLLHQTLAIEDGTLVQLKTCDIILRIIPAPHELTQRSIEQIIQPYQYVFNTHFSIINNNKEKMGLIRIPKLTLYPTKLYKVERNK